MWEGCQERKGSCNQITWNTLLHGEHLFLSQASVSGLPNTGGLPAPGHKLQIDTRDTLCARLIMDRAERFLEITSTSSKVLHPYQRPASVTLNTESIRGLSLPREEFIPTPFLVVQGKFVSFTAVQSDPTPSVNTCSFPLEPISTHP